MNIAPFLWVGGGGGGNDFDPYPSTTLKSIKGMAVKLGVLIVPSKMPPLRTVTRSDNVISHGNKVMIAKSRPFWISGFS